MGKKLELGDERNGAFELPESELQDLKPGFDPGKRHEAAATMAGSHRFPRRSGDESVPKTRLADRVRKTREKGA